MVPILMYHQVTLARASAYARYTVTPSRFARQMRVLRALEYRAISLDRLLAARRAGAPLPKRSVVITFDDCYADAIRYAVPELVRHGFTATFFAVAALLGGTSEWTRRRRIEMPLADASTLRDVARAGFTIGSHTLTHPRLTELAESERRHELAESKRRLEDLLSRDVHHFAYPYGYADAAVRQAVAECGYRTACGTADGISQDADDPLMLPRVEVSDSVAELAYRLGRGHILGRLAQRVRVRMKVSAFAR